MTNDPEFKVGDSVVLKNQNGPRMTVIGTIQQSCKDPNIWSEKIDIAARHVYCAWFANDCRLMHAILPTAALARPIELEGSE